MSGRASDYWSAPTLPRKPAQWRLLASAAGYVVVERDGYSLATWEELAVARYGATAGKVEWSSEPLSWEDLVEAKRRLRGE